MQRAERGLERGERQLLGTENVAHHLAATLLLCAQRERRAAGLVRWPARSVLPVRHMYTAAGAALPSPGSTNETV